MRQNAIVLMLLMSVIGFTRAEELASDDDLASEFKHAKVVRLNQGRYEYSYRCQLFTESEYEALVAREEQRQRGSGLPFILPGDYYLVLEVKKDRLILGRDSEEGKKRVTVVPLRYISQITRSAWKK